MERTVIEHSDFIKALGWGHSLKIYRKKETWDGKVMLTIKLNGEMLTIKDLELFHETVFQLKESLHLNEIKGIGYVQVVINNNYEEALKERNHLIKKKAVPITCKAKRQLRRLSKEEGIILKEIADEFDLSIHQIKRIAAPTDKNCSIYMEL